MENEEELREKLRNQRHFQLALDRIEWTYKHNRLGEFLGYEYEFSEYISYQGLTLEHPLRITNELYSGGQKRLFKDEKELYNVICKRVRDQLGLKEEDLEEKVSKESLLKKILSHFVRID
jgi:hypothetical protein